MKLFNSIIFFFILLFSFNSHATDKNFYANILRIEAIVNKVYQGYVNEIDIDSVSRIIAATLLDNIDPSNQYIERKRSNTDTSKVLIENGDSYNIFKSFEDSILYFHLVHINSSTVNRLESFLTNNKPKAIILDLQYCTGGLLPSCINIADCFLPKKRIIVSTKGRNRSLNKTYKSKKVNLIDINIPIITLISPLTSSGGELIAASLQDNDRSVLLGTNTAGIGKLHSIIPIDSDTHIKLTTAHLYSPVGRPIQRFPDETSVLYKSFRGRKILAGNGINPDIKVHSYFNPIFLFQNSNNLINSFLNQTSLSFNNSKNEILNEYKNYLQNYIIFSNSLISETALSNSKFLYKIKDNLNNIIISEIKALILGDLEDQDSKTIKGINYQLWIDYLRKEDSLLSTKFIENELLNEALSIINNPSTYANLLSLEKQQ